MKSSTRGCRFSITMGASDGEQSPVTEQGDTTNLESTLSAENKSIASFAEHAEAEKSVSALAPLSEQPTLSPEQSERLTEDTNENFPLSGSSTGPVEYTPQDKVLGESSDTPIEPQCSESLILPASPGASAGSEILNLGLKEESSNTPDQNKNFTDEDEQEDEDDDFGSFDEASFELQEEPQLSSSHPVFTTSVLDDLGKFVSRLSETLDVVFSSQEPLIEKHETPLLRDSAQSYLEVFSKPPWLQPPNWTRLKLRHILLLNLGVPINLDELESSTLSAISGPRPTHARRRSINESDLDWTGLEVPDIETLGLDQEQRQTLLSSTRQSIIEIEADNLNNTSELFLQSTTEQVLDSKLSQMQENYKQLLTLSSLWQAELEELRSNQSIFESVVQNVVGYSQKLRRKELIEALGRSKLKKGKRKF